MAAPGPLRGAHVGPPVAVAVPRAAGRAMRRGPAAVLGAMQGLRAWLRSGRRSHAAAWCEVNRGQVGDGLTSWPSAVA